MCRFCGQQLPEKSQFCTQCGNPTGILSNETMERNQRKPTNSQPEEMNMTVLYVMVSLLILTVLFPPWESPPGQPPEFLGFHFIANPPTTEFGSGIISYFLWTIALVTVAIAGFYFSWYFRKGK